MKWFALIDTAKSIRGEIEKTYSEAYKALQKANITLGVIENIANGIEVEKGVHITYRSVMGVEIPKVSMNSVMKHHPSYGFSGTNSQFDIAYRSFVRAKEFTVVLAEVENSVYRLAMRSKRRSVGQMRFIILLFPSLRRPSSLLPILWKRKSGRSSAA